MGHIQRRLVRLVMAVVRFPKLTLGICAVLLVASAGFAWAHLTLTTNQDELLTPKLQFFRDYQKFNTAFPENESFVVIVQPRDDAHPPPGKSWMDFADHLAAALQALPDDVKRVDWRVKPDEIGAQGILFAPWGMVKSGGLSGALDLLRNDPQMQGYFMQPDETKRGTPAYDKDLILLLNVYANRDYSSLKDVTEPLKRMRAAVETVGRDFPEFQKPVITGRPALEADEMATSDHDTTLAEMLGLSVVFVALLLFLRNLWLAIVAELCLGVGIAWTFGWAAITVGRLNLLSLVFVIALTGIGMDYLIQILTRYRFEKKRYGRPQAVWARVFRYVSPPISTACCGAAGAFFASVLTNFSGAAELGVIAGGGLLLCLLAGYTVLPALLTLFPARVGRVPIAHRYRHREPHPHAGGWRLVPAGAWILIAIAGLVISLPPRFDPNLLNLQADGVESVREVRRLQTWYAVLITDDVPTLTKAWAAVQPVPGENTTFDVERTEDLSESLVIAQEKQAWMEAHQSLLSKPPKLDIWKLPDSLREHLVSGAPNATTHTYALYIYPKDNLWESDKLERFVGEVEKRFATYQQIPQHPVTLTGIAPQLYHSTLEIHKAFLHATLYALALIVILVWLDLRKPTQTLLAISVLALGLPMLLLAMAAWRGVPIHAGATLEQLTGIPGSWNFANFFGLPILIGAGHEYGVFLVHRYRESLYDPRRIWRPWDVSDRALLLCAIVTTSSFGFLVLAKHHGLQSLGWVMAVGTACIYLSGLLVLRPILVWRLKHKRAYKEARQPVLSV